MASHNDSSLARRAWLKAKAPLKRSLSYRPVHDAMVLSSRFLSPDQAARLPAPASVKQVRAEMGGVTFVMENPSRCILAKELYWGEGKRPNPVDQTALDLFAALVPQASTVLDVGTYTGIFSLLSAAKSSTVTVHAFEVVPEVFLANWSNVFRNNFVGRIETHLRAVGSAEPMTVTRGDGGSALPDFLSAETAGAAIASAADGVSVPGLLMDDLLQYVQPGDVLMKMDIEGGEPAALASGQEFLSATHPDILCEVLEATPTEGMQEQLKGLGYRFFAVDAHMLREDEQIKGRHGERDWLFTTKPTEGLRELLKPVGIRVV